MKWSFATVGLIIIGLFGIIIILLFHEITVSNEQDYYTLKEATEASMIEAIDATYYRLTGEIKMSQEKFVENFTRRFTETSTFGQGNYNIEFYQIIEYPAKVSLRIVDATNSYNIYTTFDTSLNSTQTRIVNELSAILDGYELVDNEYAIVPENASTYKSICVYADPKYTCKEDWIRSKIPIPINYNADIGIVMPTINQCQVTIRNGYMSYTFAPIDARIDCPIGYTYDENTKRCYKCE